MTRDEIMRRIRALDYYEQSQWLIMRSDNYGGDDPDLLGRQIDKCAAARAKLLKLLAALPSPPVTP